MPVAVAQAAEPAPIPDRQVSSFRAVILDPAEVNVVWWSGHDRIGTKVVGTHAVGARSVVLGPTERSISAPGEPASILRRRYVAAPDGGTFADPLLWNGAASLWARHRAGRPVFKKARVEGAPSLRARVPIALNACSGAPPGVRIFDLHPRTLLPLRITTKLRVQPQEVTRYRYRNINRAQPRGAFRFRPGAGPRLVRDDGFRRTAPRRPAAPLGYVLSLPREVPSGFRRIISGWAPCGRTLGAEGTIPPRPKLFAAVYARGVERIDLTIRRAAPQDWFGSPLGQECRPLSEAKKTVRGFPATYALSHEISAPSLLA